MAGSAQATARYAARYPDRVREAHRKHRMNKRHGVDVQALIDSQGGRCAVCSASLADGYNVDHDHACCPGGTSCGACVRGALCGPCNRGLGQFRDDPETLVAAAAYLLARVDILGGMKNVS